MSSSSNNETPKSGGCPVKHDNQSSAMMKNLSSSQQQPSSTSSPWGSWFRTSSSTPTTTITATTEKACSSESINSNNTQGSCPVQHNSSSSNNTSVIPSSIEEAAKHAQTPQPGQTIPLSTHRTISSIPKANSNSDISTTTNTAAPTSTPSHQPSNNDKWVYPSEQQFYNAMKRKGWEIAPGTESTIPFVVQIHNAVNERGWKEIREWEHLRCNTNPKLVKFIGRPQDLSPKARVYSMLWLRKEPFDRHDWYVSREDGSDMRRYVIDFYNGKESTAINTNNNNTGGGIAGVGSGIGSESDGKENMSLPSMYLDVRPALDDTDAVCDHMKMFVKDAFPGIAPYLFKR